MSDCHLFLLQSLSESFHKFGTWLKIKKKNHYIEEVLSPSNIAFLQNNSLNLWATTNITIELMVLGFQPEAAT